MQRNKFPTRQWLLESGIQIDSIACLLPHLPLDSIRPIEIVIREQVKSRGNDQNGLYWKRVGEIAEQGWVEGRQYGKDAWHEYFRQNVLPDDVELKDGEMRSKWIEVPMGKGVTVVSTTALSKACFAEYTEMVTAFGASLGVRFTEREYG